MARTYGRFVVIMAVATGGSLWCPPTAAQSVSPDHSRDPRPILVQVQQALTVATRGRWRKRQQALIDPPQFADSLVDFRRATRQMLEIDQQLTGALARDVRQAFTQAERQALHNNVRLHLATIYLDIAECFAVDSADRINACSRGIDFLQRIPERQLSAPGRWAWYLAQIRAQILMQRHHVAEQWVDRMLDQNPPLDERWLAEADRARCRLIEGRPAEGLNALRSPPLTQLRPSVAAELAFVKIRCLIAIGQQTFKEDGQTAAAAWQDRATAQLKQNEALQSEYWLRRAEWLLARSVEQRSGGGKSGQLLKRTADNYYRRGELDVAASTYQEAVERALLEGNEESALEWSRLAAAVRHQQDNLEVAVTQLRDAALRFSSQPRAAETHWMALMGQAEACRKTIQSPGAHEKANKVYQEMLAEHLDHWPKSRSAIEAHAWSARSQQRHQQWHAAIGHCQTVLRRSPDRLEMLVVLGQCYRDWLNQLRQSDEGTTLLAQQAAQQLSLGIDRLPAHVTRSILHSLELLRAEIELRYLAPRRDAAGERLQRLLTAQGATASDSAAHASGKRADGTWQRSARILLVEGAALSGDWHSASAMVTALGPLDLTDAIRMSNLLDETLQDDQAEELGRLQTQILQQVDQSAPLATDDQNRLNAWQARALIRSGELEEAQSILEQLASRLPTDGAIQEEYAKVLTVRNDVTALRQWRQVLSNSRPATERWYRAKYAIAEQHYKMGDRDRAGQMIRLLRALHPDLGGARSRARFETLLDRCES